MSYSSNPAARYQELDVLSMSPGERLLLLFRHLESNLRLGNTALLSGDIETRAARLLKASDIIGELLGSLDEEQGGELAVRLGALYSWMLAEIPTITSPADSERLSRLVGMIADLRTAWTTVVESALAATAERE